MKHLACLVATMASLVALPTWAGEINEQLRATLLQMGRDDQQPVLAVGNGDPSDPAVAAAMKRAGEAHVRNGELIRQIVREHGWPGRSLVGEDASHAAWLVVQHEDADPAFQRTCLTLMQAVFANKEVTPQELSFLTDRVLRNEGKKQMYGTQGVGVISAEDEARVDRNREALGLEPWRIFIERRKKETLNRKY